MVRAAKRRKRPARRSSRRGRSPSGRPARGAPKLARSRGPSPKPVVIDVHAHVLVPEVMKRTFEHSQYARAVAGGNGVPEPLFQRMTELPLRLRCFENWLTERIHGQFGTKGFLTEVGAVTYLQRPQTVLNIRGLFELLDGVRDLVSALDTPINRGLALETLFRRLER